MYISDSWPFLWGLWSCRDQSPRASLLPVGEDRTLLSLQDETIKTVHFLWSMNFFLFTLGFFLIVKKKDLLRHEFCTILILRIFLFIQSQKNEALSQRENDKSRVNYIQCHCCLAVINSIVHKESILFVEDNFEIFLRLQLIHNVTLWYLIIIWSDCKAWVVLKENIFG